MTDSPGTTAIADMAALPGPGGGKLGELYSQVGEIKSEVATQAAESFRTAATSAGDRGKAVQDAVNAVEGKWQGEAAEAFLGYMNRFTRAGSDIQASLGQAATSMDGVAERLRQLKTDVDKALSDAADEAKRVNQQAADDITAARDRLGAGEPPENVPDPARIRSAADTRLKEIRDEAERKVEGLLETAEADLSKLLGGIKVDLDGDGFCGIQPPASDSTTASSVERVGPAPRSAPEVSGGSGSGGSGSYGGGGGTGGALGPSGGPPSSGPPPGNVGQWIREAIKILQANGIPVTEDNIDEIWTIIEKESGGDPHAINNWDCVPLNTKILTKRGWLKHNEVEAGDHTIGHDLETGRGEWTRIHRVVHYGDAPLVRVGNSRWHATTTPNHRWLVDGGDSRFVATTGLDRESRVVLAAPAGNTSSLSVTTDEAGMLGEVASAGYSTTGCPADLLARAGHPRQDAVRQVLSMSADQRTAWLQAVTGTAGASATGEVLEAALIAVYLSGARPEVLRPRAPSLPDWSLEALVRPNNPVIPGAFLTTESAGRGDVWCVSTGLGTWTAMEDEHVFLTGNSNAAKGTPSKGLMQCIDPTFQAHKLPGHDDIYNPVDNIIAGVRYTFDRYGGFEGHPGLKSMAGGGGYQGY